MKHTLITALSALLSLGLVSSAYAFTSSCTRDVYEMQRQIDVYGSITSHDGHRFHEIRDALSEDSLHCSAGGYIGAGQSSRYVCRITWSQGDWGDTFRCKY